MNKRWRNVGLYVLAVITVIFIGTSVFDKPSTENATKTLRYSDFIEAVQDKEISRVLISPDNATAQVVENDGSRSEVNLAPDKDLLKILTENNVDLAVTPTKLANPWQQAVSSLIFPVLLIGGLFFLFRRSQSGNAGGGNTAMSFGKRNARLQMEPSTQVTFSDVAGVEGSICSLALLFPKLIAGLPPPAFPLCDLLKRKNNPPIKRTGKIKLLIACCHGLANFVGVTAMSTLFSDKIFNKSLSGAKLTSDLLPSFSTT